MAFLIASIIFVRFSSLIGIDSVQFIRFETVVEETPAIFAIVVMFTFDSDILFTLHV